MLREDGLDLHHGDGRGGAQKMNLTGTFRGHMFACTGVLRAGKQAANTAARDATEPPSSRAAANPCGQEVYGDPSISTVKVFVRSCAFSEAQSCMRQGQSSSLRLAWQAKANAQGLG